MDGAYKYRPRFKDIRIKPPKNEARQEDKVCEHPQCRSKATARAPKSPANRTEFYWFCQSHAAQYNKDWNFFEGMSEDAAKAHAAADFYGHRPTWSFGAGSSARRAAQREPPFRHFFGGMRWSMPTPRDLNPRKPSTKIRLPKLGPGQSESSSA